MRSREREEIRKIRDFPNEFLHLPTPLVQKILTNYWLDQLEIKTLKIKKNKRKDNN